MNIETFDAMLKIAKDKGVATICCHGYKRSIPVFLTRYPKTEHSHILEECLKSADPDDVIGKGVAFIEDDKLIVRITFEPKDLNPRADKIFRKLQFGSLHAVSVGFRSTAKGHMGDEERGEDPKVYYYNGQELLEVSVVNIPSNANALKRSLEEERKSWDVEEKEEIRNPAEEEAEAPEAETDYTSTIARARALLAKNNI